VPLPDIRVAAVAVLRERRLLLVTARGRDVYYLPGGKIEPGESARAAAVREAREEVGLDLDPADLDELFTVVSQAHGEPDGRLVRMTVFGVATSAAPEAAAEVDAVHWVTTADAHRFPPAGVEVARLLVERDLLD
jgi:8-oxo-dGTP diphosphatase